MFERTKLLTLLAIDSLLVPVARLALTGHSPASIAGWLVYWLVHFVALVVFLTIAGTCVAHFQRFWLNRTSGEWTKDEAAYAVLMTIFVGAIFALLVAGAGPTADVDEP